jgi:hypothetical protein
MRQSNQRVGISAAVLRIQPENRADFAPLAGDAAAHVLEQAFEAVGRVGVGEKRRRVTVLGRSFAPQHLCEVRGELRLADAAALHVVARFTKLEQGFHWPHTSLR